MKKSASPRIAILGPNTFSAEARNDAAIADEPTNTVNHDVKRIEEQMVLGYELLALYKQETGTLRGDIDCLMNTLINKVEETQNEVDPQIYADYKSLKGDMKNQKEENELLYKTLLNMKRETQLQKEKVNWARE